MSDNKKGRPKKEANSTREQRIIVRMSDDERLKLELLSEETGKNMSEIMREAMMIAFKDYFDVN